MALVGKWEKLFSDKHPIWFQELWSNWESVWWNHLIKKIGRVRPKRINIEQPTGSCLQKNLMVVKIILFYKGRCLNGRHRSIKDAFWSSSSSAWGAAAKNSRYYTASGFSFFSDRRMATFFTRRSYTVTAASCYLQYNHNKTYLEIARVISRLNNAFRLFENNRYIAGQAVYENCFDGFGQQKWWVTIWHHILIIVILATVVVCAVLAQ